MLKAESEAELAGVMAHEIAHVAARHGTKQATKGQIINLATIPLIFMGGWTGYAIRQGASVAIPLGFLVHADDDGDGERITSARTSPMGPATTPGFRGLLRKDPVVGKEEPGTLAKIFSSHPPTDNRIKSAQRRDPEDSGSQA
jgi:predicted Zn-dependent protease